MKRGVSATYIVSFEPIAPFAPQTARELLDAFNERHPRGVRTHHYRTKVQDNALVGYICVDSEAGKDAVISMLEQSGKVTFVAATKATPEAFEKHRAMRQPRRSRLDRLKQRHRWKKSIDRRRGNVKCSDSFKIHSSNGSKTDARPMLQDVIHL
jgi:hypothetical protein